MNTKTLSQYIVGLRGKMPESSRTEAAIRLMQIIGGSLTAAQAEHFNAVGADRFIADCELTTMTRPSVDPGMAVDETKLAGFCNRWMAVSEFRFSDEDGDLRPVTPEMHGLRASMVAELKQLAGLEVDEMPTHVE
jgi:hypothetical protein